MKNDPRRSFWRAAGPLLGFWGIQLVMEFVIEFIIILPFMGEASSRMTQSGEVLNYQEMMNKYYEVLSPAFDKIIGGQIAIAGHPAGRAHIMARAMRLRAAPHGTHTDS